MIIRYQKVIRDDKLDQLLIYADGFFDTWAYPTGDEKTQYWEFDVVHKATGLDTHVTMPFSQGHDVIEMQLIQKFAQLLDQIEGPLVA